MCDAYSDWGSFEGRFKRDIRRTSVHDRSSTAWEPNEKWDVKQGFTSWVSVLGRIIIRIEKRLVFSNGNPTLLGG